MPDHDAWEHWWEHFGAPELRHLLLLWWDPAGIYGGAGAVDEYDDYRDELGRLLDGGAAAEQVAAYLTEVRLTLGYPAAAADPAADAVVAARIMEWFDRAMAASGVRAAQR